MRSGSSAPIATSSCSALAKYEVAMSADARDRHVGERLTRGWYFLGDAYETEDAARIAAWDQSIAWGKRCLAINPQISALLAKGDETDATAVRAATIDDVPCCSGPPPRSDAGRSSRGPPHARARRDGGRRTSSGSTISIPTSTSARPIATGASTTRRSRALREGSPKVQATLRLGARARARFVGTSFCWPSLGRGDQGSGDFETSLNDVLAADENALAEIRPEVAGGEAEAEALLAREDELFPK
jgi:hypothetical protein